VGCGNDFAKIRIYGSDKNEISETLQM